MITHRCHHILNTNLSVWFKKERHGLSPIFFSFSISQVTIHCLVKTIKEAPYASLTETSSFKISRSISITKTEVDILTFKPSFATSKIDHILRINNVFSIFHIKFMDTTLICMSTDTIIRHTYSHPYSIFTSGALSHHFHNPSFVRICDCESLSF